MKILQFQNREIVMSSVYFIYVPFTLNHINLYLVVADGD